MNTTDIARAFKRKVGEEISLEAEGLDRYIVYTPFQFNDGDHYVVVLRRIGGNWVLTDEGHTFMHLSYGEVDLTAGTRAKMIDEALASHRVENDGGELKLVIPGKAFGDALFSFVQALGRIAHTAMWTRERVKSTFTEDLADLVERVVPIGRAHPNFSDPVIDPSGTYPVTYKIDGRDKPWFVFGIASDSHCKDATITCLHYERNRYDFRSLAIFEDQSAINRRAVAQLTDVADRQFSSLSEKDRIRDYIKREVLRN